MIFSFQQSLARRESGELLDVGVCVPPGAFEGAFLWEGILDGRVFSLFPSPIFRICGGFSVIFSVQ